MGGWVKKCDVDFWKERKTRVQDAGVRVHRPNVCTYALCVDNPRHAYVTWWGQGGADGARHVRASDTRLMRGGRLTCSASEAAWGGMRCGGFPVDLFVAVPGVNCKGSAGVPLNSV